MLSLIRKVAVSANEQNKATCIADGVDRLNRRLAKSWLTQWIVGHSASLHRLPVRGAVMPRKHSCQWWRLFRVFHLALMVPFSCKLLHNTLEWYAAWLNNKYNYYRMVIIKRAVIFSVNWLSLMDTCLLFCSEGYIAHLLSHTKNFCTSWDRETFVHLFSCCSRTRKMIHQFLGPKNTIPGSM